MKTSPTCDLRVSQSSIAHPARRAHERLAALILAVTGLLTHQHESRARLGSHAWYDLRCELI